MSGIERTTGRARVVLSLVVACATLVALLSVGCTATGGGKADQQAMREAIGKFYAAQGNLDIEGMRASLYDPQNIAGLATATVPPEAQKTEVSWKNVGDSVIISVPSQELTITVQVATSTPSAVTMTGPGGQTDTLIMKKDGQTWKIDVAETEKKRLSQTQQPQGAPSGQTGQTGP